MKPVFPNQRECFCAYCRAPRRVYTKKHITATNVLLAFVMSYVIMLATWKRLDPRALFVFVVSLCLAEIFIQIRWRMGMVCKHCGFDPVLYMRDPKLASKKVKAYFERRSNELDFYFTDSPLLKKARRSQLQQNIEADDKAVLSSQSIDQ